MNRLDLDSYSSDGESTLSEFDRVLGSVLLNKYVVCYYLGGGVSSKVLLAYHLQEKKFYAMKMFFSTDDEDGRFEVSILKNCKSDTNKYLLKIKESFDFEHEGELYMCYVMPLMAGDVMDILSKGKYSKGMDYEKMVNIIYQTLCGLKSLHLRNILHSDVKPENVFVEGVSTKVKMFIDEFKKLMIDKKISDLMKKGYKLKVKNLIEEFNKEFHDDNDTESDVSDTRYQFDESEDDSDYEYDQDCSIPVKYIDEPKCVVADLGRAINLNKVKDDEEYEEIQTRHYMAPEAILKIKYSTKADVWSVGCMIYELLTGKTLFAPDKSRRISTDRKHISDIVSLFGSIPKHMMKESPDYFILFKKNGLIKGVGDINNRDLKQELLEKTAYELSNNEINDLMVLLKGMLEIDPKKRMSVDQCLAHSLFKTKPKLVLTQKKNQIWKKKTRKAKL